MWRKRYCRIRWSQTKSRIVTKPQVEKKCKGVKQYVVKNHITIDDYRECLFSKQPQFRMMNTIRSRQHNVGSERINKTALSADDDKRIILADGINTLPYGYKGTKFEI